MLTIAASLVALPTVNAQTVRSWRSFVYIGVSPNPVGVGQEALIVAFTADMPPEIGEQAGQLISPTGRAGWYDMTVTVTKPDGTNETLELPYTDPVGATWITYTPTDVGTYILQANFPGTWKNTTTTHTYYEPDVSDPISLTVQDEPIQAWQESPLPNDYWTRPINTASRDWYVLAGNWLGGVSDQWPIGGYGGTTDNFVRGLAPESAHILWTKPYYAGGIMDEMFGNIGYETSHYQGYNFGNPIIIQGRLIYVNRDTAHTNRGWWVVDLYTGETLVFDNETSIPSFGQIYNYESPNQHGGFPYLWRTSGVTLPEGDISRSGTQTWELLDAFTGSSITKIANVSAGGTGVYGKDGSILRYSIIDLLPGAGVDYYLQLWNSSAAPSLLQGTYGTNAWQWRPARREVHDGDTAFSLNVSVPLTTGTSIRAVREGEYIIGGTTGSNNEDGITPGVMWKLSLERGQEGTLMWNRTFTPPFASRAANVSISLSGVYPEDGVFCFEDRKNLIRYGYSLETMELLWESEPEPQFAYYDMSENYYEGKLYSYGYRGEIRAYNITTGEVLWTYNASTVGLESAYGGNYPIGIAIVADGKLYTVSGEHSPTQPLYRGRNLRCIDAETGEEIWSILGFFGGMSPTSSNIAMADGIIVGLNYFDMQLYAFGKGSSTTTVTASPKTTVHRTTVVIEGTVTDDTPTGRRNINNVLEFSLKGTPAISDEDMAAWMEYLFMQQAYPADAKGVEVVLSVIDPNENCYEIGRTTSDVTGAFGYAFEPEVPGTYQIIATFEGSASYGSSSATTYITVEDAPAATPEPTPTPASIADLYFVPAVTGIIIAIIVVGLLLALLLLRKR